MEKKFEKEQLIKKSENFFKWYTDVILKSGLADYAPVKGSMVLRPYGYALWENIQKVLDEEIKKSGAENAYFPLLIPEKFLKKEKKHIKEFSPELAIVTVAGGEELKERLVVRPTSETIIYQMYSQWIKSWRDLPLKINQWANVVRWEKRTRFFLRTTEFLWQEGHTAHSTHKEAFEELMRALMSYIDFYRDYLAIDGISGKKSESEKFPGAMETYSYEMLMPSGLALQGCTSHDLGQNFSRVFNIKFIDKDKKEKMVWQTCWGLTTRSIGAMVMVHGDDFGLIIPPKIAPIQVVIVPIFQRKPTIDKKIKKMAESIREDLKGLRVKIDERENYSVGWKFNEWELKGVPLRIEIGKRELEEKKITLVRRDDFKKYSLFSKSAAGEVKKNLDSIQKNMLEKNSQLVREKTKEVFDFEEFGKIMKNEKGFIRAFWCQKADCEKKIKEETKATTRVLPLKEKERIGKCVYCGEKAERKWIFAQAY